jgi:hypothetical protein
MTSDVFTNRAGPILASNRGKPEGQPLPGDTKTEPVAIGSCDNTCSEPDRRQGDVEGLDVPMGTSCMEIQESIFRQAWQLAGTQLRAAIALGITPETFSRFLRRCDRARVSYPQVPEAWPVVEVNRVIGPLTAKTKLRIKRYQVTGEQRRKSMTCGPNPFLRERRKWSITNFR